MSQLFNMYKNQKEHKINYKFHIKYFILEKNILYYVQKYLKAFAPATST